MKKFFLIALLAGVALVVWMVTGITPKAPLTARVLYHTNSADGGNRYVIAITNVTGREVAILGNGERHDGKIFVSDGTKSAPPVFTLSFRGRSGALVSAIPTSPDKRQATIHYHVLSTREEWHRRLMGWFWLPNMLRPKSQNISTEKTLIVDFPAK